MLFADYRRSLKLPEAEELFDLFFYRPAAYLLVRVIYRTPITPNQVTFLSLAAALIASWYFGTGRLDALWVAAAWYALSNIFDCADGQLARLQNSGTPHGRIVDGVADYIGTVAIFLGIGMGFSAAGVQIWWLVVAAGVSTALHAILFDYRQGAFIAAVRGEEDFHARELEKFAGGAVRPPSGETPVAPSGGVIDFVVGLYMRYMRLQSQLMIQIAGPAGGGGGSTGKNATLIRLWSFLGPTTNRTALIAFALIGRVDLYLWLLVIGGNAWLLSLIFLQRQMKGRDPGEGTPPPAARNSR